MGENLTEVVRRDALATITEFRDIFAFPVEEMLGIPPSVMCHKLRIQPSYNPVKQKLGHQGKERIRIKAVKKEVSKLLKVRFIKKYQYFDYPEMQWQVEDVCLLH